MTAALVPDGLEPLGVWDVRGTWGTPGAIGPWLRMTPPGEPFYDSFYAASWVVGNIDRASDVFRIEFYLLDSPFAVVHRYRRNSDGFKYQDPATGEAVVEPPVVVPLGELPPAHLLRTS